MNIFNKLQQQYEQLWKYIVRPSRTAYPQTLLGPKSFTLQNVKVKRHDFELTNSRGYLFYCSHFVPADAKEYPVVIYLHGNSSNRTQGIQYLGKLIKNGISLCTFDFSGCGNAEGEYVSLGYYEQQDTDLVIKYLRMKKQVTNVALWGRSMGAVTCLLYLQKSKDIKAVIVDSPFKSLKALIEDLCRKNSKIPMFILAGALKIISGTIQQKAKFSIYKLNPLKYTVPTLTTPAMFIVGSEDQLIPPQHTKELYHAYAGKVKKLKIVKGLHNDIRNQECVEEAVAWILQGFKSKSEQTKKQLKKEAQDFDFFQNAHKQEQKNEVDFFASAEQAQIQENIKKQDFSFTNIFSSAFSSSKKPQPPKIQKQPQRTRDGYEETIQTISKKFKSPPTKQTKQKSSVELNDEQQFRMQLQSNLSQWGYS